MLRKIDTIENIKLHVVTLHALCKETHYSKILDKTFYYDL